MKKILITGIPGMGKTTLGDEFKNRRDFKHIDMETHSDEHILLMQNPESFIDYITDQSTNVVITWGFYPPNSNNSILFLKNKGFKLIWLDGDRESAFREFKKRESEKDLANLDNHIKEFHRQIERINNNDVVKIIDPIIINTFNNNGRFRDIEEIINEINI